MRDSVHILVVDDAPGLRAVLRQCLEAEGFVITEAASKAELIMALETQPIKLITLDLGLGEGPDGLELAREVRAKRNVPIVMITGRSAPVDRIAGLQQGADDYITKPFHIREVVLRIRLVLARYGIAGDQSSGEQPNAGQHIAFDECVLDVTTRVLRRLDRTVIDLTVTELHLLKLFLGHPGRVLSRNEVWHMLGGHEWSPVECAIDGHVARLRSKIEPLGEEPKLIKTVRGVGYVFTGEVRRV